MIADIPGLIEGAHEGRGLGHDFLRHIERTRILFHLVDVYGYQGHDAVACVKIINAELKQHSPILAKKPMILVVNKMDLTGADKVLAQLKKAYKKMKIFPISAATGEGLTPLLAYAAKEVAKPEPELTILPEGPHALCRRTRLSGSRGEG